MALPQRQTKTELDDNVGRRKRRRTKTEVDEDGDIQVSKLLGVLRPVNRYGYMRGDGGIQRRRQTHSGVEQSCGSVSADDYPRVTPLS